jgi:hypothetical protein
VAVDEQAARVAAIATEAAILSERDFVIS